ncbi:MAG TPA: creatininase family protein [Acidimicrobiales bacterium]|jgi:creatinine amidohydrolase|nr:creatinine amidohydrolase [Actinomycetota bacterium]MDP6061495.1 creatininase family protein [Acidimicrobiales bacterium]MDP7209414.1 creatininase family protein [Acidimicrobiales bacterium]HJL88713.1 creatininase family protein [Acidimicrobiales bacterium]HJO98706.1 creatininase family protein [Acidimicrobiales bacterium]|tara:strand:+ start:16451 stop:17221 length:771 start_codon:yes stop_codon:yes gene_type:complete
MSGRLADLSGPTITDAIGTDSVVLLPVGAIEQHGPHLPLSVDAVIAEEVASALLTAVGDEVDLWLLPTLAVSKSNEHAWSPGTLWLSSETMLRVLDDIATCVATTPARRLVFLNAHGGNTSLLSVACRDIRVKHDLLTFLVHPSLPPASGGTSTEEEFGMGIHGGLNETSVFAHLRPGEANMDLAVRRVPDWMAGNTSVRFGGPVQFGWTSRDFGPDGHIGDPTGANPELGRELFDAAVAGLAEQIHEIAGFDFRA